MGRDTSFFTTVKEQVDLEDYLAKHLNVDLVPEGAGRMAAVCPFHDEDTPSFKVMESDDGAWKRWWCFGSCQEGGSVIDAAMKAENFETAHEAARYLNDLYGLGLEIDNEAYRRFAKTVQETRDDIERTRSTMADDESKAAKTAKAYLRNRGFDEETIEFFQLGVDTSRTKAGRLAIPLIDKANHPVSVANRALFDRFRCQACNEWVTAKEMVKLRHNHNKAVEKGEKDVPSWKRCPHCEAPDSKAKVSWLVGQNPKYLFVRDFDKANFLYNEHGTRQALARDETLHGLFLVEGYADVWAGWQSGHKAICSYNGAELSDWQAKEAVELVTRVSKPIILVPDFDETGQGRIAKNVRKLRAAREDIEIQIIYGIDRLTYDEDGERKRCKDLGDVLKHFGPEKVSEVLDKNCWQASEWQIREIVEATNSRTGGPFYSISEQLQICAEILSTERSKVALDHLIPYLVEKWDRQEDIVRNWFYSNLSEENATSYQHLFKDIDQARVEAREFLQDDNVIPIGFDELDKCMPGNGARPGQLAMFLGKALSVDSKILTTGGWKRMGEMEVGDLVIDPDGGEGRVTGVFPQGQRELYRVTFSDGASVDCDLEHLWNTHDHEGHERVQTLAEIIERGFGSAPDEQVRIPLVSPVPAPVPVMEIAGGGTAEDLAMSAEERFELLRELTCDTARSICGSIHEFDSETMARYVLYLARSLGGTARLEEMADVFRVHLDAFGKPAVRFIESVAPLGPDEAQCITVDTRRRLYITDDFIVTHNSGTGKAQPLYSNVLTPSGWRQIGDLREGDQVIDPTTGSAVLVNGVFPQGKRDIYEVLVSDGASCHCDGEHLWTVIDHEGAERVMTLRQILDTGDLMGYFVPDALVPATPDTEETRIEARHFLSVRPINREEAVCISLDSESQLYLTDGLIPTHNTMLASQILAHMADRGVRSIIFTLEQAAKSLFPRLVCQALDLSPAEAEELIVRDDPESEELLRPVHELYKNMLIIDNVPGEGEAEALRMSPNRIQAIIQEANMTHFKGKPAAVVAIDHLGILEVDDDAPAEIRGSENMRPGYIMQRLFAVAKTTSVFMMVLQQLPKEVEPGVAFGYDAGRGGSQQTDFCDYIFQIWRPEQRGDLDDTERAQYSGQYKLALGKNRYGPSRVAHLMFDKTSLRIMPVLEVTQPDFQNDEALLEVSDEEGKIEGGSADAATESGAKALEESSPDPVPTDTKALLDALGDDDDVEELGDPSLKDWFTS